MLTQKLCVVGEFATSLREFNFQSANGVRRLFADIRGLQCVTLFAWLLKTKYLLVADC
jgi:hypothetical protein